MTTVRGIYENGVVKLLENPPATGNQKVLVTFIEETDEEIVRKLTLNQYTAEFRNYLEDSKEDLYQEYLKDNNENG